MDTNPISLQIPPVQQPVDRTQSLPISSAQHHYKILLLGIIALLIIITAGETGYYLGTNQRVQVSPIVTQSTPTPLITAATEYKIVDGSLWKIAANGTQELFIDKKSLKDDYPEKEILSFQLSPDKSKMTLITDARLASAEVGYYTNIATPKPILVGPVGLSLSGDLLLWSPNSRYLAYTTQSGGDGGPTDLFVFDTTTNKRILTDKPKDKDKNQMATSYGNLRWASDSLSILAKYDVTDYTNNWKIIDTGDRQILLLP